MSYLLLYNQEALKNVLLIYVTLKSSKRFKK